MQDRTRKLQIPSGYKSGIVSITSFLDEAQDTDPDEATPALFSVFLIEQIASRIPVYEGKNCLCTLPMSPTEALLH